MCLSERKVENKHKLYTSNIVYNGAGEQSVTVNRLVVGSIHRLEDIKYLRKFIFPFLRSGVEVKRGVRFCHTTRNASRIRQKMGNGVSSHLVPSVYPVVCGIQREAVFFYLFDLF